MNKKIILSIVISLLLLVVITPYGPLTFQWLITKTPYYRACSQIKKGMSLEEVKIVMRNYEDIFYGEDKASSRDDTVVYIYGSNNGHYCRIYTKDNKVIEVGLDFD